MRSIQLFLRWGLFVSGIMMVLIQGAAAADGGVSLSRTRVIFQSTDSVQTLTIQNHGSRPYLVQSAVVVSPQGREAAPFLTTPPLFRLEENSKNTLRILHKDDAALPADRESVFYFTAIAVPAMTQPKESEDASLSARIAVGIQNTIKLFYRPVGLSMKAEEAQGRLTFHLQDGKVQVQNPTPYYLTFSRLAFDGNEVAVRDIAPMIAPFSQVSYPVTGHVKQAQWTVINDYGGNSPLFISDVLNGGKS
ncbi:fimbrial biogenesis chaperone [Yersinia massiliensis]|uniref:fimbrial biogenesis chaperone n=1 Tax=Yersinia massiliensis TaxID=419257 RepID=UPI001643885F|nr:molecular chaperone [Yersinia massiliensis]MCB5309390.1 molecular chaperone [Yersinia massiliensis]